MVIMKKILLIVAITLPFVFISCGDDKDEPETPDTHEWVDLGLPSGTLWATCNVGASAPEEYGDYFAWGETVPKSNYNLETYKWYNSTSDKLTKYCTDDKYGTVDYKTELEPADDAATVNWGAGACMPSLEQIQELLDNCSWQWTQRNGVYGQLGTGPNGNIIFLPAAGGRWRESLDEVGSWGYYLSRTLYPRDSYGAYNLEFDSEYLDWDEEYRYRYYGFTVRPVHVTQN